MDAEEGLVIRILLESPKKLIWHCSKVLTKFEIFFQPLGQKNYVRSPEQFVMVIVTADEISMFEFESGKELKDSKMRKV